MENDFILQYLFYDLKNILLEKFINLYKFKKNYLNEAIIYLFYKDNKNNKVMNYFFKILESSIEVNNKMLIKLLLIIEEILNCKIINEILVYQFNAWEKFDLLIELSKNNEINNVLKDCLNNIFYTLQIKFKVILEKDLLKKLKKIEVKKYENDKKIDLIEILETKFGDLNYYLKIFKNINDYIYILSEVENKNEIKLVIIVNVLIFRILNKNININLDDPNFFNLKNIDKIINDFFSKLRLRKEKTKSLISKKLEINENKKGLEKINQIVSFRKGHRLKYHKNGLNILKRNLSVITDKIDFNKTFIKNVEKNEKNNENFNITSFENFNTKNYNFEQFDKKSTIKNKLDNKNDSLFNTKNYDVKKKKTKNKIFGKQNENNNLKNKYKIIDNKMINFEEPYKNKNFWTDYFKFIVSNLNLNFYYKITKNENNFNLEIKILNHKKDIEIINYFLENKYMKFDLNKKIEKMKLKENDFVILNYKFDINKFKKFNIILHLKIRKEYNELDYLKILIPINIFNIMDNPLFNLKQINEFFSNLNYYNICYEKKFINIIEFEEDIYSKIINLIKISENNFCLVLLFKNLLLPIEIILYKNNSATLKFYLKIGEQKINLVKTICNLVKNELLEFYV